MQSMSVESITLWSDGIVPNIACFVFWNQVNSLVHQVFSSPESVMGKFVLNLYEVKLQVSLYCIHLTLKEKSKQLDLYLPNMWQ